MQHEFLTRKETAALLRCSLVTLDRMARHGKLKKIKITFGKIGFARDDLDAYLTEQRSKGGAL